MSSRSKSSNLSEDRDAVGGRGGRGQLEMPPSHWSVLTISPSPFLPASASIRHLPSRLGTVPFLGVPSSSLSYGLICLYIHTQWVECDKDRSPSTPSKHTSAPSATYAGERL
ncbi:unnamed protein product [Nesidiocoris tenuis]|uniref:Uncharacterized protein n=1 Tax=Nesidiocoris tenuis TaxID=355587 RepID=A0A6H5H802_9HEMI|nr:unnamed protein product [Nesidiocoris tenuis]